MCDQLSRNLTRQFGAAAIHGDKSQSERDFVLNQFRSGRTPVLVATDVAARGLDIKDIRFGLLGLKPIFMLENASCIVSHLAFLSFLHTSGNNKSDIVFSCHIFFYQYFFLLKKGNWW